MSLLPTDDEHPDGVPERHRHGCVHVHAVAHALRRAQCGYVALKHLGSVRLPDLVSQASSADPVDGIHLRHISHDVGSLRGCSLPAMVQEQRKGIYTVSQKTSPTFSTVT